jgi:putative spermidine/putrescine transport system permease protein
VTDQTSRAVEVAHKEIEEAEALSGEPSVSGAAVASGGPRRSAFATLGWALPGTIWLIVFLIAPVVMIVLVSFWERSATSGFDSWAWTLSNYERLFDTTVYTEALWRTFRNTVIICLICLAIGYPIAYFLAVCVRNVRWQIALFILVLAPFWTAYVIRIIAWYPVLGRQGAINYFWTDVLGQAEPLDFLLFSNFAVIMTLVQLYVLFMVTPIFFQLATLDRSAIEAARDLGASPFKVFKEVIFPLSLPGVLIGAIFVFVLCMGEFATVQIIGGNQVQSVGTVVRQYYINVDFPAAAAGATILVLAMMVGVAVLLRFAKLREATS